MPIDPAATTKAYLKDVERARQRGDATEHTYRSFFIGLMNGIAPKTLTTNEPKRSAAGAPDFIVTTLRFDLTLGYIEAKDIGVSLDEAEKSEQLRRYRRSLPNLLLTDYLEVRWYVDGEKRATARLARLLDSGKLAVDAAEQASALALLRDFATQAPQGIDHPEELARRMARTTHLIRDLIVDEFASGRVSPLLHSWHKAFEQTLLPDLKHEDFADMFAQTLAYGLFSARIMGGGNGFDRNEAQKRIPRTNPFLRDFFYLITGPQLDDEPFASFVADLVQTLHLTDVYALLENFGKKMGRADPMLHFYETFLGAYDPKLKAMRGVYYTPEPVVGWLVRSVDALLKERFGLKDGVADASRAGPGKDAPHRVLLLDPAAGTATFLYAVIRFIREQFIARDDAGQWPGYVQRDLLPRLFGFELLMAPYAVAHFKLGLELAARDLDQLWRDQWAYEFHANERLHIYLTNTLDDAGHKLQQLIGPAEAISREAEAAAAVKAKLPVLVVLGNPPYSNFGQLNKGEWIRGLLDDYKRGLKEKKLNLDDDFIKFIRWAQWRIEQTGSGIVAYITSNVYLDGLTHRRMREALLEAFDEIHIVNLHGSLKKQETSPDGSKDENVFDITVGVSLVLFTKLPAGAKDAKKPGILATLHHHDLWGLRKEKYAWLDQHDVRSTKWKRLNPKAPNFWFVPKNTDNAAEYEACCALATVFPVFSNGVKTERDRVSIHFTREGIEHAVADFRTLSEAELRAKYELDDDSRDWSVARAKADVTEHRKPALFREILYRPFDIRHTWYSGKSKGFIGTPGSAIMRHMISGENLALCCLRQSRRGEASSYFVTQGLVNKDVVSPYDIGTLFPLYLHPEDQKPDELIVEEGGARRTNLSPEFITEIASKLKLQFVSDGLGNLTKTFGPEAVFKYAYAVFHSPGYRARYAEFLRTDFPRLPLTSDTKLFRKLCGFGSDLTGLHLLRVTGGLRVSYPVKGTDTVDEVTYEPPHKSEPGRVRINAEQWFDGVPPETWTFRIGGYQVAEKWLKDRKGRQLSIDERRLYPQIIAALDETIRIMRAIDGAITEAGGWPLK
jgi:predicted helicase